MRFHEIWGVRRANLACRRVLVNIMTARTGYAAGNREFKRLHEISGELVLFFAYIMSRL